MATKNTSMNKIPSLLKHHLIEKKKWAILTLIVLIVTIIVLPMLAGTTISEEFIAIGIVEVFIVILVNCLIDFSYLHDSRKFGYYASKPVTTIKRIHVILLSNAMFAGVFLSILFVIASVNNMLLTELFLIPVSWLLVLMLLTALSSLLVGNTIVAGLSTAFNFGLPLLILGVTYFAMDIVKDIAVGIDIDIIMQYIVDHIIKLDVIYMVKYIEKFDVTYVLVLAGLIALIYSLILWTIKHRKNEKIGDFIVFKGYKYFIALILSVMVPFIFTSILNNGDYVTKLISFVILGSLTYYVALVILEKSFVIRKSAIRLLIAFMVVIVGVVLLAGGIIKSVERKVPEISEIQEILLISDSYIDIGELESYRRINDISIDDVKKYDIHTYKDQTNMKIIADIHNNIVEDQNYRAYLNLNIIYFLKDGSQINRYFQLNDSADDYNRELEKNLKSLVQSSEYKKAAYPIVYDERLSLVTNQTKLFIDGDEHIEYEDLSQEFYDQLITSLKMDIDNHLRNEQAFYLNFGHNHYGSFRIIKNYEESEFYDYLYLTINYDDNESQSFDIPGEFTHTREFFDNYLN